MDLFLGKFAANLLIPNHKVTFGAKRVTFFLCQKMLICLDSLKKSHFAWNFPFYDKEHAIIFFWGANETKNRQIATSG